MISFGEAIERIRAAARPIGTERMGLDAATGRVLAEPIVARIDSPRSDVSTRDGYAVRDADLDALPVRLRVLSGYGADSRSDNAMAVGEGECARILTGGPIPPGADRVIMQEFTRREGGSVLIETAPQGERWIRPFASDFARGDTLVPALEELGPRTIVAAAAADIDCVDVYRQPRLHIVCTGDELERPGAARLRDGAMPETASLGVAALAGRWGAQVTGRTLLRDDLPAIEAAAAAVIERADIIVTIGGASVGDKDFAKAAFEPLRLELLFSKDRDEARQAGVARPRKRQAHPRTAWQSYIGDGHREDPHGAVARRDEWKAGRVRSRLAQRRTRYSAWRLRWAGNLPSCRLARGARACAGQPGFGCPARAPRCRSARQAAPGFAGAGGRHKGRGP